jgi:hypothetical protein
MKAMLQAALEYPETSEGIACAGTPIEKRTIKVRKKAFLFLGKEDAMVKLKDSIPDARRLQKTEPDRCKVGISGWVTVVVRDDAVTPIAVLRKWAGESYRLLAPKTLAGGAAKKAPARKKKSR